jgi:hypothetical protein
MSFCVIAFMCKDNYAATVQKIMPVIVRPARFFDRGNLCKPCRNSPLVRRMTINPRLNREFVLTLVFIGA